MNSDACKHTHAHAQAHTHTHIILKLPQILYEHNAKPQHNPPSSHTHIHAHTNSAECPLHTSRLCVGFFPGQASLAYFFLRGSLGPSSGTKGVTVGGREGGAGSWSTSGARFGMGIPSLAAKDKGCVSEDPIPCPGKSPKCVVLVVFCLWSPSRPEPNAPSNLARCKHARSPSATVHHCYISYYTVSQPCVCNHKLVLLAHLTPLPPPLLFFLLLNTLSQKTQQNNNKLVFYAQSTSVVISG